MNKVSIIGLLSCLILASSASAQGRPGYGGRDLENRVSDLEWKLEQTNRRLERLERDLSNPRPPQYEERVDVNCLLIDTGWNKTYLGTGRAKIEAEANARQLCAAGSSNIGSYCSAAVKCSSGIRNPSVRGYICVVQDSGWNRTYKAEGKNEIEAEAKARQACTTGSNGLGSYCANVRATCEAF